jgi:hypothetical protein
MKFHAILFAAVSPLLFISCKAKKTSNLTDSLSATFEKDVSIGSYYKTRGVTQFYDKQPDSLIAKTPSHFLGMGHVIQLLDPNSGGGWARVRLGTDEVGYIRFNKIKIVPPEKQPSAPKRKKEWGTF